MNTDITASVVRSYTAIADGRRRSCGCGPEDHAAEHHAARRSPDDLNLGCGAPLEAAELETGQTVLDLGSGGGREVFRAAGAVGPTGRAIGLDVTPAMIELARRNAAILGVSNVSFVLGEIEAMPVPPESVDRVISNCVINLTHDKRAAFREIHRVLRAGGRFAISDIVSAGPLPESIREDRELWAGCIGGAIPEAEYLGAIAAAGFTGVRVASRSADGSCGGAELGLVSITVTGRK